MAYNRTDRMLGDLSYLVYLFHLPAVALFLYGGHYAHLGFKMRFIYLASVWLGTFAISAAFWRYAHLPIEKLRKRFSESRPSPKAAPEVIEHPAFVTASGD
jgi:peptidoglycan/LPS O-acetylase OafA/YrhL